MFNRAKGTVQQYVVFSRKIRNIRLVGKVVRLY